MTLLRKILFLVVLCLFVISPLSMQTVGELSVTKKLSVIKTEYFDFIFPEESEPTARHLAQQADDIYRKAETFLNIESTLRFPVVITPETDVLNAYFSPFPYGRIVMYDAAPSESLAVFADSLLSVFYHEVIHALSITIKSPAMARVLGDMPSPFMMLNMPPSFSEGTAVLAESLDGEGRLNSAYSLHVVQQAKIEGRFPGWRDIAGAYQLYTEGSLPYIFGGAFSNYLYQKYGMEKFAEFWNQNAKFNFTFYKGAFEKTYALSLDDVWQEFEDSIFIPPLAFSAQPLFSQENDFSRATANQLYQNLTASPNGIAWQDGFSGNVYFLPYNEENQRVKILYTTDLTSRLHFSSDGKYLVSSGATGWSKAQNTVRVYDMERNKNVLTKKHLRDGTVISMPQSIAVDSPFTGVSSVLAGVQTDSALLSLVLYDMDNLQSFGNDSKPLVSIPFERNTFLFEPIDAGNGLVIALMQNFGSWQFFVYDLVTGEQRTYMVDEQFQSPSGIRHLYASNTMLYMSYAQTASSQPVLATVNLDDFRGETLNFSVQIEQASGGVFNPVVVSNFVGRADGTKNMEGETVSLAYLSKYYDSTALSFLPIDGEKAVESISFISYTAKPRTEAAKTDYPIEPYRASDYMDKGLFIPLIGSINLASFGNLVPRSLSVGATAFTMDPTGRFIILGGAGMDVQTKNFTTALSTVFSEGYFTTTSDIFAEASLGQLETLAARVNASFAIPIIYDFNHIRFSTSVTWFYLREQKNEYLLDGGTLYNTAEISFTHLKKTGSLFYDTMGFTLGGRGVLRKQFSENELAIDGLDIVSSVFLALKAPQLLPFKNPGHFTLNFPTTVQGSRYFNSPYTWELKSTIVLFAYDVQKAITFIPFFVQRVTLDAGIDYAWHKTPGLSIMNVHGSLFTTFTFNTGFSTSFPIDLGISFAWDPYTSGIDGLDVNFKFSLNL